MARLVRGCPTARSQQEGMEEPKRDPQQGKQPDAAEGKDIADNNLDIGYEGSEPQVEPDAQEQRDIDPDAAYAKMEMPRNGTLCQRIISWETYMGILWVHKAQGPEIIASWLQDMYVQLGFILTAAKLLVREQGLDSPERLQVLTDKNVDDFCNVVRKPGGKIANGMPNRGEQVSVIAQENLKLAVFLFHHGWRCTLDWEIIGVNEGTVHLMRCQKKLKDEYKDSNMLP